MPDLDKATPIELHIAKLELKPGDVVIVRLANKERLLPVGVKALVINEDVDLSIMRASDAV